MTSKTFQKPSRLAAATTVLAAALIASGAAQANVGASGSSSLDGSLADIAYGQGGNVFELTPQLFVQGLGNLANPADVTTLNPALAYSFSLAGAGSGLMTLDYRVRNLSATVSFNDLRFIVYANPDGDGADFADVLGENWGAAAAGDPSRRQGLAFGDPSDTLLSRAQANNNLTELPTALDPACIAAPGCDATVGLQWNAATLAPGQTWRIQVGLSDNGQHLSSRWITATAVNSADTVLTLSGLATVGAVPEPGAGWLLAAGLAGLGFLARRRQAA